MKKNNNSYGLYKGYNEMKENCYPDLEPWEPIVTGFRDYLTYGVYASEQDDKCCCCGKDLSNEELVVTGCGIVACNWEHAIEYIKKYPEFYHIEDMGAY